jgi:maltose alpha-D-glucosyltransferase / alpha-amylase
MNQSDLVVWMEQELPKALATFLPRRRWFGGKARPIAGVQFEDAAWLPDTSRPCALVVVRVRDTASEETRYALVVAFDDDAGELPVIGRIDRAREAALAIEATADERAARSLLAGFSSSEGRDLAMLRGGVLRYRDDTDRVAALVLAATPRIQQIAAEQSNTSLSVDRKLAFKLFRRLEHGENPEVEIGRFLGMHTSFRDMPLLRGSLTYVSALGQPATLGVLQDWIDSRGDGWSHVVALLQEGGDSASNALQSDAFSLGVMTENLHQALAADSSDPAFAPEPATLADVDAWRSGMAERAFRTRTLIARHMASWPALTRKLGETFVEHSHNPPILDQLPDPEQPSSRFRKIRIHGDYHLGQTLRAASGFVVIDFEGEPARSLAERRAKHAALRDVAGMLRSFDYAVEAAQIDSRPRGGGTPGADVLRRRFLDGYRATFAERAPAFAPADPDAMNAWLDFFELDKALYEVEYEINNRPTWVHIPLRGLVRIVGGHVDSEAHNAQAPDGPRSG